MRNKEEAKADREILKRAACLGCRHSLEMLYKKYQPVVYDYLKRAGADGMAEDICQSLFMRLCEWYYAYDGQANTDDYLCAVAKNIFRNLRRIKKEAPLSPQTIEKLILNNPIDSVDDPVEVEEMSMLLEMHIEKLPSKSRQAIKIVYMDGFKGKETLLRQTSNQSNVFNQRLRYGIRILRNKLKRRILKK